MCKLTCLPSAQVIVAIPCVGTRGGQEPCVGMAWCLLWTFEWRGQQQKADFILSNSALVFAFLFFSQRSPLGMMLLQVAVRVMMTETKR